MIVYVALKGENCCGGEILGVYTKRKKAVEKALATDTHFSRGWIEDDGEKDRWENGCDFVKVEKWRVKE